MEWFNRVTNELQDQLNSICEQYDQIGQMTIDRGAKHPLIEFFVETKGDERDYFCTLLFDPYNEEFYIETFDYEFELLARVILTDIEDVIDAVHDCFHDFINGDSYMYVDDNNEEFGLEADEEYEEYYIGEVTDDEKNTIEELVVEWETPEITAFQIEDEVEVTYQLGVVRASGNGVLRRVNRFWSEGDEIYKEETNFTFAKEEASTIIALIASNMDTMISYENQ